MSAPSLSPWARLASIATLGTQRAPLPADVWPDPALAGADASAEQTLLRAAAATHLWQVAGRRTQAAPEPSPSAFPLATDAREASEAAAWRLARMLDGEQRELVSEWLELARAGGRRLPTRWLPVVLDALPPAEIEPFAAVLGEAAQWLAGHNPRWVLRATALEPSEQRWLGGALEERVAELALQRAQSPERAREWIERTWAEDPPEAREAFVRALAQGLSSADEPLLERALDDKRKSVRVAAAECLARLPSSAHAQRNLSRIDPLIELEAGRGGLLARFRARPLTVRLPEALDKCALRDGIEAKPPAQRKIGERAFWLVQMLGRVPPVHWTARFACEPAAFLAAAGATEYAAELLAALVAAAARHPDVAWIEALCDAQRASGSQPALTARALADLIGAAPAAERPRLLEAQLAQLRSGGFATAHALLEELDSAWTPGLSSLALSALAAAIPGDRQSWPHPRSALESWARRCHVATARPLVAALQTERSGSMPWGNAVERLHEIVEFRAAMQEELRA